MAQALGLNPRKLIKNIPSPSQRWKAPVRNWVRELYRKRHGDFQREAAGIAISAQARSEAKQLDDFAGEDTSWLEPEHVWPPKIREEDRLLRRRQEEFRAAADYVTVAFAQLPVVDRVVLFGSVARPLRREIPRFREFRRAGVALPHECKDVDLAVWLSDTSHLEVLRKTLGRAVNALFEEAGIGVAHHQVDVFLLEPGSDRYLGRLCHFGTCPKGKPECLAPGCGAALFLRQHEAFVFDPQALDPARSLLLFDRAAACGPPSLDRWRDETPF
ncbi:MAG TPA: hypothetical protein VHR45_06300 [Thermoanaerobaculia bacterium]|nr:hypothetical protein [Thermoanaerobaculia bacterium]